MSGEEQDYAIETADAGASATIPMEAGQIKKGGYVFMLVSLLLVYHSDATEIHVIKGRTMSCDHTIARLE